MTAAAAYLITILAAVQTTQRSTVIAWMERVIYDRNGAVTGEQSTIGLAQ